MNVYGAPRKSLELFASEPVEAPRSDPRPVPVKPQLWLAVCLPSLALESLAAVRPSRACGSRRSRAGSAQRRCVESCGG